MVGEPTLHVLYKPMLIQVYEFIQIRFEDIDEFFKIIFVGFDEKKAE